MSMGDSGWKGGRVKPWWLCCYPAVGDLGVGSTGGIQTSPFPLPPPFPFYILSKFKILPTMGSLFFSLIHLFWNFSAYMSSSVRCDFESNTEFPVWPFTQPISTQYLPGYPECIHLTLFVEILPKAQQREDLVISVNVPTSLDAVSVSKTLTMSRSSFICSLSRYVLTILMK